MPANLSPQYIEAEERYRRARTNPEKIKALQEMLAIIPKHKGTEKIQGQIRRRISKLKEEGKKKHGSKREGEVYRIKPEGAAQVALVGSPNSGKSTLVCAITHATPEVAPYPFSTRKPTPGMMTFENVQIQLVDLPPLGGERVEPWMHNLLRGADLLLMVIDLDDDPVPQVRSLIRHLEQQKVKTLGREVAQDVDEELEFFEDRTALKRALLVGNKKDLEMSSLSLEILQNEYGKAFTIVSTSAVSGDGLDELRATIFKDLEIVRAYTKAPGKEADLAAPFILKRGSTVQDLAEHIHKDFVDRFKYARIWGPGRFQGQRVHREFVLEDGDVIELHM